MNRSLTSLFAAFEALLVVAIGIGITLAPLTILWGAQYGFAPDWWSFWRASVDIWLLGHGADLTMTLDTATATSIGFAGAADPFVLSVAVLGFALLTILLAMRTGRRVAQTDHRLLGEGVAIAVFAALSFGLTASAQFPLAQSSLLQGTILPTACFALGMLLGTVRAHRPGLDTISRILREWITSWPTTTRAVIGSSLRGGAAATAAIVAVGSIVVSFLIFTSYAEIITLYEALHAGALGGFALTLAQIAFLPNLVLWGVAWLVGPGFAIGTGSTVSPLATNLGPIPAIPVLGALPSGDSAFAFIGILVPVLAGFLAGALLGNRQPSAGASRGLSSLLTSASPQSSGSSGHSGVGSTSSQRPTQSLSATATSAAPASPLQLVFTGVGMGLVGGALLGLLTWAAAGSAGPGRLAHVGGDPWQVGLWAALEIGLAAIAGLFAASHLPRALSAVTSTAANLTGSKR